MPNYKSEITNQPAYKITALQDKVQALHDQGVDIINATIGDPKDDTPSMVPKKITEALSSQSYSQYPMHIGSPELRHTISNWAKQNYHCELNKDTQIMACNGTKEAIYSFPMLFDWSGAQSILIPSLSYPVYQMSANYMSIPTISLITHN